jgi:hypothetical protein
VPRSTLLFTAAVLLGPPARAQIPPDDRIRAEFLAWYKTFDRDEAVSVLLRSQQAHLVAKGASPPDAAAEIERIRELNARRPDAVAIHFDKVYRAATPAFNLKPNAFLVEVAGKLRPGTALDMGRGQGRNAIRLAQQGWRVTGFDIPSEGLALARENARHAGVACTAVLASNDQFGWSGEQGDLAVKSYVFVPLQTRPCRPASSRHSSAAASCCSSISIPTRAGPDCPPIPSSKPSMRSPFCASKTPSRAPLGVAERLTPAARSPGNSRLRGSAPARQPCAVLIHWLAAWPSRR